MCPALERCTKEKGLRLLLHGPPQFGKSIVTSQRLIPYALGMNPTLKTALACYNIEHSEGFGSVLKGIMESETYIDMYPGEAHRVHGAGGAGSFFTLGRRLMRDAQPSFLALGMLSGFTGKGPDLLIIDDPYKSAEEAKSPIVNGKVISWWRDTASVRMSPESNIIVMFHRYHLADLAQYLLDEGGWEEIRFPAIADANEDRTDPTGRRPGQLLSPLRSAQWINDQKEKNPITFLGQFQGRPIEAEGLTFKVDNIRLLDSPPPLKSFRRIVRSWDKAASTSTKADWTVGTKIGIDDEGYITFLDMVRGRWDSGTRDGIIRKTAEEDGKEVDIVGEQEPGSSGVDAAQAMVRLLHGFRVTIIKATMDKVTRADPLSAQINIGNTRLVKFDRGKHQSYKDLLAEVRSFPAGAYDDIVDTLSSGYNHLVANPGVSTAPPSKLGLPAEAVSRPTGPTRHTPSYDENGLLIPPNS